MKKRITIEYIKYFIVLIYKQLLSTCKFTFFNLSLQKVNHYGTKDRRKSL